MDLKMMSAVELAFVGDAVYELLVREHIVRTVNTNPARLHALSVSYVKAEAQHRALAQLTPHLSEQELAVARRGRNATKTSVPKNSNPAEYRDATALEALFGYLFLAEENQRLQELFALVTEVKNDAAAE